MLGFIAAVAVVLATLWLTLQFQKMHAMGKRLPPGPSPVPLLGNLWTLKFKIRVDILSQLAGVYGNVFTVWLQHNPVVVLNGFQAVRDGLTTHPEDVSGRPSGAFIKDLTKEKSIAYANGHIWKDQRRLVLTALRSLGMGKRCLEHRIQEEGRHLVESIRNERGQPFNPLTSLTNAVMNMICAVVFGYRFPIEDETFQQLFEATNSLVKESSMLKLYDMFPWIMRHLPGPHQRKEVHYKFLQSYINKEIKLHAEKGALKDQQDIINFYLAQSGMNHTSSFIKEDLSHILVELFMAGSGTTVYTLLWSLLYMVAHPEIQDKVRKELKDVLTPSQEIFYEDREKLPYTNAVIHEVQRVCSVASLVFRKCMKDTTLNGFSVPKGTLILANIRSSLQDPKEWKNPQQFDPNHFLDEFGKFTTKDAFLPFSTGNRVCVGEKMARTELFILFATLMRTFEFKLPAGVKPINMQPMPRGNVTMPHPYKLCAVPC